MVEQANSPSFPPTSKQIWRYVSDRAGILSWATFPVIWLFGMRNNLLMGLTGWDFGTFNNFHRWIARIATLQAVVHSVGYTVIVWRGMSLSARWTNPALTVNSGRVAVLCGVFRSAVLVDRRSGMSSA